MGIPWTPGPWVASCADVVGERPLGDSGLRFWNIEPSGGPHEKYRGMVACAYSAEHIGGITVDERNANARLIEAAPEMAEALEYLEDAASCLTATFGYIREDYPERSAIHTHEGHTEAYLAEMIGKARALLARIRGEGA